MEGVHNKMRVNGTVGVKAFGGSESGCQEITSNGVKAISASEGVIND